jgi:hypothetical protein
MYTFHEERVLVPAMIPYAKLLAVKKHTGRKQLLTYKISWLRTLAYFKKRWSYKVLYTWAKRQNFDLDDQLILDSLRKFKKEVKTYTENTDLKKVLICMPRYFVWDNPSIWKVYKTKEEVAKYKSRIVLQYNTNKRSNSKIEMVLEQVNNNPCISFVELVEKLAGKVCRTTILKIVRQNNIALSKKSRMYLLIDKKLNELFTHKSDQVKGILTYQLLGEWIGVNEQEIKRFMKENPDQKIKYLALNKEVRERIRASKKVTIKTRSDFDF